SITDAAIDRFNIQVVPEDTVVVSFKLTVGRVAITSSPMATNEAIAHFQATSLSQVPYIYEYLRNFQYDTLGNTSSISKAVNSKIIKSMPFVMPDGEVMEKFYALAKDIFKLIKSKTKENKLLIESRDLLLPKLMSGEIEV
ncbi:MAG TPA: restriction endonuclease subunit S, partial [Sutterella sp.]|nr:restriction endonuclease subunit S [Sutterella sp.]